MVKKAHVQVIDCASIVQADPEAVETLECLLDQARKGELIGFAFVAHYRGGDIGHGSTYGANYRPELTAGVLMRLCQDVLDQRQ